MQLSLSSAPSSASSESADLLNAPAGASTDEPATGFGDLMADLLPEAEVPADPAEAEAPVSPAAADAAAAQVVVDLMAWMVRTPPPPPAPATGSELPEGEIDLSGEGRAQADALTGEAGAFSSDPTASGESLNRWGAREVLPAGLLMSARNSTPPAPTPAPGSFATAPDVAPAVEPTAGAAPQPNLLAMDASVTSPVVDGQPGGATEVVAATVDAAESGLAPVVPATVRGRTETRGEKIAAGARGLPVPTDSLNSSAEKNFLNVDKKEDAEEETAVGISVAKSDSNMPALATPSSFSSARPDSGAVAAVMAPAGSAGEAPAMPAPIETPESIAHTAVAAVTKAVERAEAAPRTAVNLQFSIGDSDLVVRIEHRADEVRATFRTDSGELRAALSTEWQTAVSGGSDHALRRVEPVFTSASNTDDQPQRGSSEGNAAWSQQRQAGRESAGEPVTPFAAFMRRPSSALASAASEPATAASAAARSVLLPTALHLQTFA